jgi:hypothetical protein
LAPGPTIFLSQRPCGHHDPAGEAAVPGRRNHARIVGAVAVGPAAAWCWLHSLAGETSVPTLAFVPGIIISGRYRMCPPS